MINPLSPNPEEGKLIYKLYSVAEKGCQKETGLWPDYSGDTVSKPAASRGFWALSQRPKNNPTPPSIKPSDESRCEHHPNRKIASTSHGHV